MLVPAQVSELLTASLYLTKINCPQMASGEGVKFGNWTSAMIL